MRAQRFMASTHERVASLTGVKHSRIIVPIGASLHARASLVKAASPTALTALSHTTTCSRQPAVVPRYWSIGNAITSRRGTSRSVWCGAATGRTFTLRSAGARPATKAGAARTEDGALLFVVAGGQTIAGRDLLCSMQQGDEFRWVRHFSRVSPVWAPEPF